MYSTVVVLLVAAPLLLTSAHGIRAIVNTNIQGGIAGLADNEEFDALTYLERAGYLDDLPTSRRHHAPDNVKQALREFQQFFGLPVTGRVDAPTITEMRRPRCGNPDVIKPSLRRHNQSDPNAPLSYVLYASEWHTYDITYKWIKYTNQLSLDAQRRTMAEAFERWSRVTPLNFREVRDPEPALIDISFVSGRHEGCEFPFDGHGGTLAHTFPPGLAAKDGDMHFDDDEGWVTTQTNHWGDTFSLVHVATHEIGHALGMGHSDDENAIMYPHYDAVFQLGSDDIQGIQKIYGPRGSGPSTENFCGMRFDAITMGEAGGIYAFKGQYYYTLTRDGPTMKRRIADMFPGAPDSPDAVTYDRFGSSMYFFKGQYYYRYRNYKLHAGFPKLLGRDFQNIDSAIMRFNRQFYLFKGGQVTRWEDGMQYYPPGFPKSIKSFYDGNAPDKVDAAFEYHDKMTFLFNSDRYWKYIVFKQQEQFSPGYPKSIKPFWLHCGLVSGRDEEPVFGYVG